MKKFVCRIYRCYEFKNDSSRYEEVLSDVKLVEDSKYCELTLQEVHQYFVSCVRRHSANYPKGRYRVTTSMTRCKSVVSSYMIV